MVADPVRPSQILIVNAQPQTVFRKPHMITELPTLPKWQPRTGRNDNFIKWYDALISAEADLEIELEEKQPLLANLPLNVIRDANISQMQYIIDVASAAAEQWQHDSNTLFDMIKASLDLDGPHLERDLRTVASFTSGKHKDARALRKWALSFADLTSIESQTSLRTQLSSMKLREESAYSMLEKHCRVYWSTWSKITGNDPTNRESCQTFYVQWLATLPSTPAGSHLASVRKWLAERVTDSSPILASVDDTIDALLKYASVIGLTNTNRQEPVIAGSFGALNAIGNGYKRENKCDFCECYACHSRELGGVEACLCRWDSTFDLAQSRLSDATKQFITRVRSYHKAHKDVSSLKNIKLPKGDGQLHFIDDNPLLEDFDSASEFDDWLNDHLGAVQPSLHPIGELASPDTPKRTFRELMTTASRVLNASVISAGGDTPPCSHVAGGEHANKIALVPTTNASMLASVKNARNWLQTTCTVDVNAMNRVKNVVTEPRIMVMIIIATACARIIKKVPALMPKITVQSIRRIVVKWADGKSKRVTAMIQAITILLGQRLLGINESAL